MWYLGETRYVLIVVSLSTGATITSAVYTIYSCADESIADSGAASISGSTLSSALWTPSIVGFYVVDFDYVVGLETFTSRQVIEVKETI